VIVTTRRNQSSALPVRAAQRGFVFALFVSVGRWKGGLWSLIGCDGGEVNCVIEFFEVLIRIHPAQSHVTTTGGSSPSHSLIHLLLCSHTR
jgi:hypothetical protein